MFKRMGAALAALVLCCGLTACSTISDAFNSVSTYFSESTSSQSAITSYGRALQAATIVDSILEKVAVASQKDDSLFSKDVLVQARTLSQSINSALAAIKSAQDSGQTVSYATFNALIDAWNTFAAANGLQTVSEALSNLTSRNETPRIRPALAG